jgi:hypothetical protein
MEGQRFWGLDVEEGEVASWALALFRLRDTDASGVPELTTISMRLVPRAEVDAHRVWTWLADPLSRPEHVDVVHRGWARSGAGLIDCLMVGYSIPLSFPPVSLQRDAAKDCFESLIKSFAPAATLLPTEVGLGDRRQYELFRADARQHWDESAYELVAQADGFHTRLLALDESVAMGSGVKARGAPTRALSL